MFLLAASKEAPVPPFLFVPFTAGMLLIGVLLSIRLAGARTRTFAGALPFVVLAVTLPMAAMVAMLQVYK